MYHSTYKLLHPTQPKPPPPSLAASPSKPQLVQPVPPPLQQAQPAEAPLEQPTSDADTGTAAAAPSQAAPAAKRQPKGAPRRVHPPPSSQSPPQPPTAASAALEALDKPFRQHRIALPEWQPPPSSLQHRTALTRAIMACRSYAALHALLAEAAPEFNVHHTCACLSRVVALQAAGLSAREARLFKDGCAMLLGVVRKQLPDLHPRAVAVTTHALAKLELADRELLLALALHVEPSLSALQPQGLSSLIWAMARLGFQPPTRWMDGFLGAVMASLPDSDPRDTSLVLWSLAKLGFKAVPGRLAPLMAQVEASMCRHNAHSLSTTVYALALVQHQPGSAFLDAVQARATELGARAFSPQGMTQLAWGLARLGAVPSQPLLGLIQAHLGARLAGKQLPESREAIKRRAAAAAAGWGHRVPAPYHGIDYVMLLYALGTWRQPLPAGRSRQLLAALMGELSSLEPNQLCNAMWACARLHMYPPGEWFRTWFDSSFRKLSHFKTGDLSQALWALARMGVQPPPAWLSAVVRQVEVMAGMFQPQEVANTMWAVAKLHCTLPADVLVQFFMATDRRLSAFKPQELCAMAWALARMRGRPDKEWSAEFLKATYHKCSAMGGWALASLAWSLSELQLVPPPAWMYHYVTVASAHLDELSALDLGNVITGLRRLNAGSGLAKVDAFIESALDRLGGLEAADGAYSRQQVNAFLSMSRHQAGLPRAASVVIHGQGEGLCPDSPDTLEEDAWAEHLPGHAQHQQQEQATSTDANGAQHASMHAADCHDELQQQRQRRQANGAAQPSDTGAHVVEAGVPRVLVQTPAEFKIELGDLNLDLGGVAGGAMTMSVAAPGGNGAGAEQQEDSLAGSGSMDPSDIKRRLVAAA